MAIDGAVTRVTATEASRGLADLLDRVQYRGERFLVLRHGEPIAVIVAPGATAPASAGMPVEEMAVRLAALEPVGDGFADDLASAMAAGAHPEPTRWS
jgi:prevent-host-death family protein